MARRLRDFVKDHVVAHGDPHCPFCPGQEHRTPPEVLAYRDGGGPNQPGWRLRVVPNKYPALRVEGEFRRKGEGIYDKMSGIGAHEVIIETADHVVSQAELPEARIEDIFWAYRDRILDLRKDRRLRFILLFKNHGTAGGSVVDDSEAPGLVVLADPEGNRGVLCADTSSVASA